ncbi:hypothetical protein P7C73_g456, partial [Tremellales sp. Uapishka_1]
MPAFTTSPRLQAAHSVPSAPPFFSPPASKIPLPNARRAPPPASPANERSEARARSASYNPIGSAAAGRSTSGPGLTRRGPGSDSISSMESVHKSDEAGAGTGQSRGGGPGMSSGSRGSGPSDLRRSSETVTSSSRTPVSKPPVLTSLPRPTAIPRKSQVSPAVRNDHPLPTRNSTSPTKRSLVTDIANPPRRPSNLDTSIFQPRSTSPSSTRRKTPSPVKSAPPATPPPAPRTLPNSVPRPTAMKRPSLTHLSASFSSQSSSGSLHRSATVSTTTQGKVLGAMLRRGSNASPNGAASIAMARGGRGSRTGSGDDVVDLSSPNGSRDRLGLRPLTPDSGSHPTLLRIPTRGSSVNTANTSPTQGSAPQISPRKSSMSIFAPYDRGSTAEHRRRASRNISLGDALDDHSAQMEDIRRERRRSLESNGTTGATVVSPIKHRSRPSTSGGISSPARSNPSPTRREPSRTVSPSRQRISSPSSKQNSPSLKQSSPSFTQSSSSPSQSFPTPRPLQSEPLFAQNVLALQHDETAGPLSLLGAFPSATPPTPPRPLRDRKAPGLSILPPPMVASRKSISVDKPSPPIPAKSPLRSISGSNLRSAATSTRGSSIQSNKAEAGTPSSAEAEEIRFTMLSIPSEYSQDSAPPTATSWVDAMTPENEKLHEPNAARRGSRLESVSWGAKRDPRGSDVSFLSEITERRRSSFSAVKPSDKDLPDIPSGTLAPLEISTGSMAESTFDGDQVESPISTLRPPPRIPSLSSLKEEAESSRSDASRSKAARLLGFTELPLVARAQTEPYALLPAPALDSRPPLSTSPSITLSKRSHLIREIVDTERAYANDLALIRDAYIFRFMRPGSGHSTLGAESDFSRRSSIFTYQTAETKRSSGHESFGNGSPSAIGKSTSELNVGVTQYASPAEMSSTNLGGTPQPSPRNVSGASSTKTPPAGGKPLAQMDVKAVFLNLEQLASFSEDLATELEKAMGEEEAGPGAVSRDGEAGTDRIGEVFVSVLPRLQPLYAFYCARQAQASHRLLEIQADPSYSAHLNECWALVKPHTRGWNLDSMLIKPIQRITKYPLLFDDLLRCTSPVHPDYFNIRKAKESAKTIAIEIDEMKRRKDVVERVVGVKKPIQSDKPPNLKDTKSPSSTRLLGFKFKKEKERLVSNPLPASSSSLTLNDVGHPPEVSQASHAAFKDVVSKLEEADQCVKIVGKEILNWKSKALDVFGVQKGFLGAWQRFVKLDDTDAESVTIRKFRGVIDGIVMESWQDMNREIEEQIMPALSKLLLIWVNPKVVITKRDSKAADYVRYQQLKETNRPIEKALRQSAHDFVALHSQLVEELPMFLEGYMRIFDLAIVAFARAQAKYHWQIKDRIEEYAKKYVLASRRASVDEEAGKSITQIWFDVWAPYAEAMDHFTITRPTRHTASRIASFNVKPGSRPASPAIQSPKLRHSNSTSSTRSRSDSPAPAPARGFERQRQRSTSLIGQPKVNSPLKSDSRFHLFGKNTRPSSSGSTTNVSTPGLMLPPSDLNPLKRLSSNASSSSSRPDNTQRYSFGLPRIDPSQRVFEGIGLSPEKSTRPMSHPGPTQVGQLASPAPTISESDRRDIFENDRLSRENPGLGYGNIGTPNGNAGLDAVQIAVPPTPVETPDRNKGIDASEGWKGERVLYQCGCVADFDPVKLGDKEYRGLRFLPMVTGDLLDVFHEVGRIEDLGGFPYPQIGYENDGVLVGRAESGRIGLLICSFLEPLTA